MGFTVIYDANVLYPNTTRDVLIRVAQAGLVQAKWTKRILTEMTVALRRTRPDITEEKATRLESLMCEAVRDCLVEGYESLERALTLPDPDDRHVLAAAIRCGAQVIVTNNVADFPDNQLNQFGIEAKTADAFILDQIYLARDSLVSIVAQIAASRKSPPQDVLDVLDSLQKDGQRLSAAALRVIH
ncbi:PIN domain-containing protein [Buchananella felis]|uniref:PIN domain-containing protein n=1 Tax=Buchananella felis TaxID=3231492 RepID=UPI003527A6F2